MGGGALYAQDGPATEPSADVTVPMQKQAQLSPTEMVAQAESLIRKMQEALKRVVGLQQVARKQKDVIKLNCVNDKLLQIKQLLNIAEAALTNTHEAIAQHDDGARYHEFSKLVISEQQVGVLVGEAENCIGEELVFLGPTEVIVDGPDIPDPTERAEDRGIEDPAYASPFT
jgi:uncharacterized protein YfkK (UPF0435 family)